MRTICAALLILSPICLAHDPTPKLNEGVAPSLETRVTTLKDRYRVGETIKIHVELGNMGDDPIYVGNEIPLYDWVYALHFTILNDKGKASEQTHFFHPYMPEATNRETPVANLTKHWLVLPPGYFVGTVIALNPGFFEALKKPGDYVIQTVYSCEGMDANISSNPIGADPNFVHSLPYKSWKGTKEANRIIVHIYQ